MKPNHLLIPCALGLGLALVWALGSMGGAAVAAPGTEGHIESPNAPAAELHVCPSECTYSSIQDAVDAADDGDVIKIAAGTYTEVSARPAPPGYEEPPTSGLITQVVYITKTITVRGGYTTAFTDPPDPEANPATLDAQGQGRVLLVAGNITPTVEGLRITGGNAAGLGGDPWGGTDTGGGVYAISATVSLIGNHVFGNVAQYGGGVGAVEASLTISGSQVFDNVADGEGGGVYVINASGYSDYGPGVISITVSLLNNQVFGNSAGAGGGGVYVENNTEDYEELLRTTTALFSGNRVFDNTAGYGGGGGLRLLDSTAALTSNIVTTNTATGPGGGLSVSRRIFWSYSGLSVSHGIRQSYGSVSPRLNGNTFRANRAGWLGGGVYLMGYHDALLSSNVIVSNTAEYGGGLFAHLGGGTFINTVVTDNRADSTGSGLCFTGSRSRLLHTTIARNRGGDGSGVCLTWAWSGTVLAPNRVVLTNTIVASQTVGITVTGYGGTPGFDAATLDGVLWFNNGANAISTDPTTVTQMSFITITRAYTGDPAFAADGHHLMANSAAIDRGTCAGVATDVDGELRPSSWGCDLGADEFPVALSVTKRASPDPVLPGAQLTYTIRVTNTGSTDLHATITDTLPAHVTLDETAGETAVLPDETIIVAWTAALTTPGTTWMGTVIVTVDEDYAGSLTNRVEVTTEEGAMGEASVTVSTGSTLYLPVVLREM